VLGAQGVTVCSLRRARSVAILRADERIPRALPSAVSVGLYLDLGLGQQQHGERSAT
jgi:hypothetical protein